MTRTIRIGARRSPLAVAQAEWVAAELTRLGHPCELVGIDSLGDVDRRRLTEIGGTGIFATAVREQLHDGRIDVAVHSLKDLPVAPAPGLRVAAVPRREDVRDVLVGAAVEHWHDGTVVGTGSPRRAVQLQAMAAARGVEIRIVPIRGNVDTRFSMVSEGGMDATVLAAAGLLRLGRLRSDEVTTGIGASQDARIAGVPVHLLSVDEMLPAPGQGALAVECCDDAADDLLSALAELDDADTRAAITAERSLLARLEAGCLAPLGALGRVAGANLTLQAVAGKESSNGSELVRGQYAGAAADAIVVGRGLAEELLPRMDEKVDVPREQ